MSAGSWAEQRTRSGSPKASADIYDFFSKQTESDRLRRIREFEEENALLRRTVSEIQIEIVMLRKALQRKTTQDQRRR